MERLSPVSPPYSAEVTASFAKLTLPGMEFLQLFRVLAHNPRLLQRIQRGGLLDPGSISIRLRELAILRTCALCGAEYEWGVHVAIFAGAASLSADDVSSTWRTGSSDARWGDAERLVLRLCEELHATQGLSDASWAELSTHFTSAQLLELTALAGMYHMISFVVNAGGVQLETWAPRAPA
ncbi:MAG: carboxymuconolactone decarboxylase family protein [Myxococcales bacterium]